MLQLRKQRRERGCIPLFTQKANKTPRQGVCTVYVGPQAAACPTLISLLHESQKPRQISRRGEPLCSRWEFSLKRRIRKEDMGGARFPRNWSLLYFPGKLFILLVVHRDQWIIQSYAASAALILIETRLSLCIPSCIHKSQVIYIIFWPEGQLTFYGPFLIRVCQPEDLFVLFFPKSGATLRKH